MTKGDILVFERFFCKIFGQNVKFFFVSLQKQKWKSRFLLMLHEGSNAEWTLHQYVSVLILGITGYISTCLCRTDRLRCLHLPNQSFLHIYYLLSFSFLVSSEKHILTRWTGLAFFSWESMVLGIRHFLGYWALSRWNFMFVSVNTCIVCVPQHNVYVCMENPDFPMSRIQHFCASLSTTVKFWQSSTLFLGQKFGNAQLHLNINHIWGLSLTSCLVTHKVSGMHPKAEPIHIEPKDFT